MTAIISDSFKSFQAQAIANTIRNQNESESLYIYTAFPDSINNNLENDVTPPTPTGSSPEFAAAYANMLTMHKIPGSGVSQVTKRVSWTSGVIYSQYSTFEYGEDINATDGLNSDFYVIAIDDSSGANKLNVYKCLFTPYEGNSYKSSTVSPSGTSINSIQTSDGYFWKFMYTIPTSDSLRFLTENSMPVPQRVTEELNSIPPGNARRDQYNVENNAIEGELYSLSIGNKDVSALGIATGIQRVTFANEGVPVSEAEVNVVILNNEIINVVLVTPGSGYSQLTTVSAIGGVSIPEGHLTVNISPSGGHGFNAITELAATSTTINVRIVHDVNGDITTQNDFRQIGIIRNPISAVSNRVATRNDFRMTYRLIMPSAFTGLNEDDILVDTNSVGIRLRVVGFENNGLNVYVNSIGNVPPSTVQLTTETPGGSQLTPSSVASPEIIANSGDLLYIENRKPLNRSSDQVESFNITFEF